MNTVERTFNIPENISSILDTQVPAKELSAFVTKTLTEALQKRHRDALLEALENVETWEPQSTSVVDVIRAIRKERSERLVEDNNH